MSDTSKRPGARDISELKARLGLKKGAAPSPAAGGRPGGMVAPPGARTGAVPAPPGAHPPRPAVPDASHDPFGAMNAMAAHGAVAAQPQIVIVNDGQPVEAVAHKRRGAKLAVYGAILLAPLVFGSVIGRIAAQNKAFNATIADAGKLRDDVKGIGKSLQTLQQVLQLARERGGGKFAVGDEQLIADLDGLAMAKPPTLVEPNFDLLTQLDLTSLGDALAKETLELYSETTRLNATVRDFVVRSKRDLKALKDGRARAGEVNPFGFGLLVGVPTGEAAEKTGGLISVKLVQLGQPVCLGEKAPSDKPCQPAPEKFQYRPDESSPWTTAKVSTATIGVADAQLILLDPTTKVFEGLIKGGEASVTETTYLKGIESIREKLEGAEGTSGLVDLRKNVETKLNNVANRGNRPTFFL